MRRKLSFLFILLVLNSVASIGISYADTIVISPDAIPEMVMGNFYNILIEAEGEGGVILIPPVSFSVVQGELPRGLSLDVEVANPSYGEPARARLYGIPDAAGIYKFVIKVSDSASPDVHVGYQGYSVLVKYASEFDYNVVLSPDAIGDIEVGRVYDITIGVEGGYYPYVFSVDTDINIAESDTGSVVFDNCREFKLTLMPQEAGYHWIKVEYADCYGVGGEKLYRIFVEGADAVSYPTGGGCSVGVINVPMLLLLSVAGIVFFFAKIKKE